MWGPRKSGPHNRAETAGRSPAREDLTAGRPDHDQTRKPRPTEQPVTRPELYVLRISAALTHVGAAEIRTAQSCRDRGAKPRPRRPNSRKTRSRSDKEAATYRTTSNEAGIVRAEDFCGPHPCGGRGNPDRTIVPRPRGDAPPAKT